MGAEGGLGLLGEGGSKVARLSVGCWALSVRVPLGWGPCPPLTPSTALRSFPPLPGTSEGQPGLRPSLGLSLAPWRESSLDGAGGQSKVTTRGWGSSHHPQPRCLMPG